MISPDDIRDKAVSLYRRQVLRAWLDGDETFFPRVVPAGKSLDPSDPAAAIAAVRLLRHGSKEVLGYGYTVHWQEVNSRKFGRNMFPERIVFETRDDLLRLIGKQREFTSFTRAVARLRAEFPALEDWVRASPRVLIKHERHLEGLLGVLRYFRDHPRPNRFPRELPLSVDTKFIERHKALLWKWLDLVLPPQAIRAEETQHFERRFGLRYAETHLLVRLLDPHLQEELRFPCRELSIPLHTLAELPVRSVRIFIMENKVNLLTFPSVPRGIALGGLGDGVVEFRYLDWLHENAVTYWGDLDVAGFHILSRLRAIFPKTGSLMMDRATLERWKGELAATKACGEPAIPAHLTEDEQAAFLICCRERLWLEQERLPQWFVAEMLAELQREPPCGRVPAET